ncbi:enoyl-CoA hydratase-related protein [Bacillaceae bacterium]
MRVSISRVEKDGKITLQESAGLAIVTLHRSRYKNAMTANMWKELAQIGKKILQNPKTKVVILRGAGDQFTAGSDIKEFNRMTIAEANQAFALMEEAISTFEQLPIPTLGVICGHALGAGFELALACDLRIGTPSTKMGIPIGRLGITLSRKFTKRIVDLIGPSRTKDLVYTGRLLDAGECYRLGLINYLLAEGANADRFSVALAKKIGEQSPASLRAVKEGVAYCRAAVDVPWKDEFFSGFVDPFDFPEGVRAFVEKRKPNFRYGGRLHVTACGN